MGHDHMRFDGIDDLWDFNPRAHMGHDRLVAFLSSGIIHFNPRAHMGHDTATEEFRGDFCISIHVPTWGTTPAGIPRSIMQ